MASLDYKHNQIKWQILKLWGAQLNALYMIYHIVLARKFNISNTEETLKYPKTAAYSQT